jgi:hypothetical protein
VRKLLPSWTFGAIVSTILAQGPAPAHGQGLPGPDPIPEKTLGPVLPTHPVRRTAGGFVNQATGKQVFSERWIDASLLPRDKQGIWVLDFAFKPVRIVSTVVDGKRRQVHYLYYQVINRTGKPRMFVPQFTIVTDTGKRIEDTVLPKVVEQIQTREDPSIPILGAVNIMGIVPPSTKDGIDDAVFGVGVWEAVDPHADKFSVYVRGLSDGYQQDKGPDDKPVVKYKTLRIDFIRRGDQFELKEKEIQVLDPPYEWIYW